MNIMLLQMVIAAAIFLNRALGVPLIQLAASFGVIVATWLAFCASRNQGAGTGARRSRGPGKPELSLEALRSLLVADGDEPAPVSQSDFHYLEVSVQETSDNKIVVLHPLTEKGYKAAFPRRGPNEAAMEALEGEITKNFEKLSASEVTLEQLQSLHLYGEDNVTVATLEDYLRECRQLGLNKPIAVEVRHLFSDVARACLIRVLSNHIQLVETEGLAEGAYRGLGIASLVADPSRFTASFAEFGTPTWAHWATRMRCAEVAARLKCCHSVNLGFMAPEVK